MRKCLFVMFILLLYLELHRGTYTTQARTKRNNRLLEFALRNAEFLCAFAAIENKTKEKREEGNAVLIRDVLLDCWKRTLTNQFHDIIPGSSIGRVYAEAEKESREILARLAGLSAAAKKQLVGFSDSGSALDSAKAAPACIAHSDRG